MASDGLICDVLSEIVALIAAARSTPLAKLKLERVVARIETLPLDALDPISVALRDFPIQPPQALIRFTTEESWRAIAPEPLAPLLLFHRSGFVRQAALNRTSSLPDGPILVVALAQRLNDWVEPVRAAAAACAERVLPSVSAKTMAAAAPYLLARFHSWQRWGEPPPVLLEALRRDDRAAALAATLIATTSIPGSVLKSAIRLGIVDRHLAEIARRARRPEFRAAALRPLIDGRVSWLDHYDKTWVDKRFGIARRTAVLAHRPIERQIALSELIGIGAKDASALVRYVAAERLVCHAGEIGDTTALTALFKGDKSRGVRWLMAFLARQKAGG
ncbi:MAG TPA: hypothetical protein PK264_20135 [Hyphomicrobiaceae bacterium]|nr:hypothetical protein [Hyphomicrobiaceae bacterium]